MTESTRKAGGFSLELLVVELALFDALFFFIACLLLFCYVLVCVSVISFLPLFSFFSFLCVFFVTM